MRKQPGSEMKEVIKVKVTFSDTDAMGIAYHGNYLKWFEMGRTELLRATGISYRELVEQGIHLPVIESFCRYIRPARYDDVLSVASRTEEVRLARIRMGYEIRKNGEKIAKGYTVHAFTDEKGKVIRPPKKVIEYLKKTGQQGKEDRESATD